MWVNVAIVGLLLAYIIFDKIVTHKREIDLIDRALPRTEKEKAVQEIKKKRRRTTKSKKQVVTPGKGSETEPRPF